MLPNSNVFSCNKRPTKQAFEQQLDNWTIAYELAARLVEYYSIRVRTRIPFLIFVWAHIRIRDCL